MSHYHLIITDKAQQDIDRSVAWYEERKKRLGIYLLQQIKQTSRHLKKNPCGFPIRYSDARTISLKKFPFLIHYTILDRTVLIAAIFHTSLSPEHWKERLGR